MRVRQVALFAFTALLALGALRPAHSQTWPQRPVTLVVPFAAGGNTDGIGRSIAQWLSDRLGQQFVVENRAGAGGAIAAEMVAKAPADGYTLFVAALPQIAIVPAISKTRYDPVKDFAPISVVGTNPFVLAVNKDVPVERRCPSSCVEAQQVVGGLPAQQDPRRAVADRHHPGPRHVVVVARHRPAVGAGGGHRDQVADGHVARQVRVPDHDVPALAVPADQPAQHRRRAGLPGGEHAGVLGVVQRGADVVAHAAVDAHVGPQPVDVLDGADLVQRDRARARRWPGPARRSAGAGPGPPPGTATSRMSRRFCADHLDVGRVVARHVRDAEAAAQVQLVDADAAGRLDPDGELEHPVRGHLEAGRVVDLRADVRVQAGEVEHPGARAPAGPPRRPRPRRARSRTSGHRARWPRTRARRPPRRW